MAHILAVDDDHDLCALLKTALERDGHTVETRTSGTQLGHAERLGQVIVRTKTETGQYRRLIGAGRQKQNRRVRLGANAAADGKAVLAGHHHIQQDAVRPGAVLRRHLRSACQRRYSMAVPLQCAAHKRAHIRIVVYHQNMCHSLATISISHCIHKYKSHESPYKT